VLTEPCAFHHQTLTPQPAPGLAQVPNQASACYVREIEALREAMRPCNFGITVTTSSFFDAFDDDQTLMYEPESTAAIILSE
jgi:hypothetical protein